MVKPEQGKLGLDLQISVCSMARFIGGSLRGRQADPAGFPLDWAVEAWRGDSSPSLLSRDDAFHAKWNHDLAMQLWPAPL